MKSGCIDLEFYTDGHCKVLDPRRHAGNMEADWERLESVPEPDDLVSSAGVSTPGSYLEMLLASHELELEGRGESSLEYLLGVVFRAGIEFGRKNPGD